MLSGFTFPTFRDMTGMVQALSEYISTPTVFIVSEGGVLGILSAAIEIIVIAIPVKARTAANGFVKLTSAT